MTERKPFPTAGDLILIVGLFFLICVLLTVCISCASSDRKGPPPRPTPKIVEVVKIAPCIIRVAPLEKYVPPELPPYPGHDADDAELKAWALVLGEEIEGGRAICIQREEAWQAKIEAHNASEPLCVEPVPTPTP